MAQGNAPQWDGPTRSAARGSDGIGHHQFGRLPRRGRRIQTA